MLAKLYRIILNPITNDAFNNFLGEVGIADFPAEGLFDLYKGKVYFNHTAFNETLDRFYPSTHLRNLRINKGIHFKNNINLILLPFRLLLVLVKLLKLSISLPKKIRKHIAKSDSIIKKYKYMDGMDADSSYTQILQIYYEEKYIMFLHLSGTFLAEIYYQFFNKICEKWIIKKTGINTDKLLSGLDAVESAKTGEALWRISNIIKKNSLEFAFKNADVSEIENELDKSSTGRSIRNEINRFIDEYGHSALHEFELLYPRWRENRSYIYSNIRNYLNNEFVDLIKQKKTRLKAHEDAYKKAIGSISFLKRIIFIYVYKKAAFFSIHREKLKQNFLKAHNEIKKHILNIEKKLKESQIIKSKNDIFYLKLDEISKFLNNTLQVKYILKIINERKNLRSEYMMYDHPVKVIQAGDEWRPVYENMQGRENALTGIGCSSGIVEGTAKVIISENEFDDLKKGEILVARSTKWNTDDCSSKGYYTVS